MSICHSRVEKKFSTYNSKLFFFLYFFLTKFIETSPTEDRAPEMSPSSQNKEIRGSDADGFSLNVRETLFEIHR